MVTPTSVVPASARILETQIFVSYSRNRDALVRELIADLKTLGYACWFDEEVSGGQSWWDHILARLRDCDVFIFALDPDSLMSNACNREFEYARALGKPIVPVLVAPLSMNLLPPTLAQIKCVDYRKTDRVAVARLAKALRDVPHAGSLPHPLPSPPEAPLSYLGSLARDIEPASDINDERQWSMVFQLQRGLRDPESADDARTLLQRLRRHPSLLATVAEEIDKLLDTPQRGPTATDNPPVLPPGVPAYEPPGGQPRPPRRMRGALSAAAIGTVLLAALAAIEQARVHTPEYERVLLAGLLLGGIPWALAGAFVASDRRMIYCVLLSITALVLVGLMADGTTAEHLVLVAWAIGPGAVPGAMVAAAAKKLRKW